MPANLENSTVATGLEKVSFHSSPKEGKAKECSNYSTIALISHIAKYCSKFSKPGFNSTAEEPEIKLPIPVGSLKSKRVPQKHLFLLY